MPEFEGELPEDGSPAQALSRQIALVRPQRVMSGRSSLLM